MTDADLNAEPIVSVAQADRSGAVVAPETGTRLAGRIVREDEWLNPGLARRRATTITATGSNEGSS